MRSINFVQSRQKKISQVTVKDKKFRSISVVVLGVGIVILILSLAVRLFQQQMFDTLERRKETATNALMAEQNTEREYTIFVAKLKTLTKLFESRKDKQEVINYLNTIFGDDVTIDQITYSAEDQTVQFAMNIKDIFALERVYGVFNSVDFSERYPTLEKSGLRRDDTGRYTLSVEIFLDGIVTK